MCIIGGIPRHSASALPFEIVQNKDRVVFLYMYTYFAQFRSRRARARSRSNLLRNKIGRWEGNTFVIDSVGFKGSPIWIDENANPQSDAMHVVERGHVPTPITSTWS